MSEAQLQRAVAQLLEHLGWLWWHTANERSSSIQRRILAGQGVRPGVADVIVLERWERGGRNGMGVAIELKSERGRVTDAQQDFLDRARLRGALVGVCRTMDAVEDLLRAVRPQNGRRLT